MYGSPIIGLKLRAWRANSGLSIWTPRNAVQGPLLTRLGVITMLRHAIATRLFAFSFFSLLSASLAFADEPAKRPNTDNGLPDLAAALKESPGCIGVETARTASGKNVIFAWFEDKKAALKWYYSDTHVAMMKQFFPDRKGKKPLADVPDDSGPIMAIASITLTDKPTKENPLPYKQIAIELYQPIGGGISIGGRFAPEKMKVPPRKSDSK